MAYIVSSTEKVRGKGADYETKAMLYLMGGREKTALRSIVLQLISIMMLLD
jgi:hypothetical protein